MGDESQGVPHTQAEALVGVLHRHGVRRLFGIPGGGSSLDLIQAAERLGIDFVLTRTEAAAAIMAATTAELGGMPGVVLTGLGPGVAAAVNGIAHAALDRAAVVLLTDALSAASAAQVDHQRLDQPALLRPLVEATLTIDGATTVGQLEAVVATALAPPQGPVQIELDAATAGLPSVGSERARGPAAPALAPPSSAINRRPEIDQARSLLAGARLPVLLIGLEARSVPAAARALAAHLGGPVLTTWKAKGVVPSADPRVVGLITGGVAEAPCLDEADLIVQLGFDPVELIPRPWPYQAPIVDLATSPRTVHPAQPAASLVGPLTEAVNDLLAVEVQSSWPAEAIRRQRAAIAARQRMVPVAGISPEAVIAATVERVPVGTRATIDAGAHMFPAIAGWPAAAPCEVLISNGLATMGFALPAAIAAALADPSRPVVAFTGDGGLAMGLGELATAAERGCRIVVVVLNDATLSLIALKQQARGLPGLGSSSRPVDFAAVARGLGVPAWSVAAPAQLGPALEAAFTATGPALVDVTVDPAGYPALLRALRG